MFRHLRLATLCAVLLGLAFCGVTAQRPIAGDLGSCRHRVRAAALPLDRPGVDVRPHLGPRGLRRESGDLLRGHGARRRVEDDEQRRDVRAAVPGQGPDVDRRRHGVADGSEPGLGRHAANRTTARARRGATASTSRPTAAGRGRNMGLRELAAHQPHRHRSDGQQHRASSRRPGRSADRAAIAASTRRPTAARRGSRC